MKCPFCDIEMMKGYFQTAEAIWSTGKNKTGIFPDRKEQYAFKLKLPFMTPHYVESDFCPKCRRLIIDTTDYESNIE